MTQSNIRGKREHWQTPVCNFEWLDLSELRCDRQLEILVKHHAQGQSWCFKFLWQRQTAYRSTYADVYTAWDFDPNDSDWHNTHKILNSRWVSELEENYDADSEFPNLQHFVLCTADYVIEVLSEVEPLIQQWTILQTKAPTYAKSEYELVLQEPMTFYAPIDEANFFNTLKDLPEVAHVTGYPPRDRGASLSERQPNEIVLSLSCEYLSNASLRSVIGLLARYNLPMAALASQCAQHNSDWFADVRSYWHEAVFNQKENKSSDSPPSQSS